MVSATLLKVTLSNSSGKITEKVQLPAKATVFDLKTHIKTDCKRLKLAINRQKLSLSPNDSSPGKKNSAEKAKASRTVLEDERSLISYGVKDNSVNIVKDLGPQISWKMVFVLEYLGPLLIHLAYMAHSIYWVKRDLGLVQLLAFAMITFHFLKREYETIMVHRFSHATMPLSNLFKNSAHYWILSGFGIGHFLYAPSFTNTKTITQIYVSVFVFIVAELANFRTHLILRDLRPAGTNSRAIPRGFGFALVSCPNYFFEMLAWCAFSFMTGLPSAWFFTIVASGQMWLWALKKHQRYLKEFPQYPKNRKPMIPFLC
jgi:very-long-chain enoyl-CoA reductase